MTGLPAALSAARPVETLGHYIEIDGVTRLALVPAEVAPLLGLTAEQVRGLCKSGLLRARNTHPGSVHGRYLISVGALIEYLAGSDEPVPSAYG